MSGARHHYLMPVILVTWKAEIRRIVVLGKSWGAGEVCESPCQQKQLGVVACTCFQQWWE
jgi:hypothetical protein